MPDLAPAAARSASVAAQAPNRSDILALGAIVAIALLVGMGLGWLVDSAAGTDPAFLLVGLLLGVVASVAYAVSQFRKYLKK